MKKDLAQLGSVAHACNPNFGEAKAGELLQAWGQAPMDLAKTLVPKS